MQSIQYTRALSQRKFLVSTLDKYQVLSLSLLSVVWLTTLLFFIHWWFDNSHISSTSTFLLCSFVVGWNVLTPIYFVYFILRMKKPNPDLTISSDVRVAMVVTKAPSEPFSIVQSTLRAMLSQSTPHDTWLADEAPSDSTRRWCAEHGVKISTRQGVDEYHNKQWPRRTKCKEGNLAYFYDHFGYMNYDIVVQLDADHVPQENYLEEMLRPFSDPEIGYVSAPSLCTSNFDECWASRGRAYAESAIHGAVQSGYSDGFAPLCIGSHYAVRTSALKTIGGLGPDLAEDHSTTLLMNAHGWKGVHAINAIALGQGPATFMDFITQEYQWSKSVTTIGLTLTPKLFRRLSTGMKFQFVFAQSWYTFIALTILLSHVMPPIAILTNTPWLDVVYLEFMLWYLTLIGTVTMLVVFLKKNQLLRPMQAKVISWEIALFYLTRWPWILIGVVSGIVDTVTNRTSDFKVTPKGSAVTMQLPLRLLTPYLFIVLASLLPVVLVPGSEKVAGYYFFALFNGAIYSVVIISLLTLHKHEANTTVLEPMMEYDVNSI